MFWNIYRYGYDTCFIVKRWYPETMGAIDVFESASEDYDFPILIDLDSED